MKVSFIMSTRELTSSTVIFALSRLVLKIDLASWDLKILIEEYNRDFDSRKDKLTCSWGAGAAPNLLTSFDSSVYWHKPS